jgi:putative ABC transport system permease protein
VSELRRLLRRLANAFFPGRAEAARAREVAAHVTLIEDEYRRQGLSEDEARPAARRAFGSESANDRQRDARSFVWLDDLRRDVTCALRGLGRSPAFTLVAILTLSLAIGANAAIFTVADHVLVRSLPAPHADRLVRLYSSSPDQPKDGASMDDVADWRRAASSFDLLTAFDGTTVTIAGAAGVESVIGMLVGPDFFTMTGVHMPLGRPFAAPEYASLANAALANFAFGKAMKGSAAIILSDPLWRRQFGADPQVVGRHVRLNDGDAVIAGVMPADFRFNESSWGQADCWIPLVEAQLLGHRRYRQLIAIGRLRPGVSLAVATAEMTVIARSLQRAHPQDDGKWTVRVEPLKESMTAGARPTLLILLGGVGCVLLVACANVTNLLVVRTAGRHREIAVRVAIGAGRGRLVRQWLTESTMLALAGGATGLLFAVWAVPALTALAPPSLPRLAEITVDGRTLLFGVALSVVTGIVCGVAPALGLGQVSPDILRSATALGSGHRRWLRPMLVTLQVGLALVLLVVAGLMARSFAAVRALDLGFDPSHVLTFGVNLIRGPRYHTLTATREFTRDLLTRLRTLPSVLDAGNGGVPLLGGLTDSFQTQGGTDTIAAGFDVASPGYFRALGFRLEAGRFFSDADDSAGIPVVLVNRAFARRAWGTSNVLGCRLRQSSNRVWLTVVGVVGDTRRSSLEAAPPPLVYFSYLQSTIGFYDNFVVRTSGPPVKALPAVRDLVRQIDPTIPVTRVATMDERVAKFVVPREFNLWLIGLFSLLAFVLAVVGLYGLVSELVTERTPEIGVRMALGATQLRVVRLVIGGSVLVTTVGVAAGLVSSVVVTRSLGSMIFGVTPLDPVTLVAVPVALLASSALAAAVPARRATNIDPVSALRRE